MQWFLAFALAVLMGAAAIFPTYFWLRLTRLPAPISVVVSPAVTFFLTAVLGFGFYEVGVRWSGITVLPVLALIGLAGFGLWYYINFVSRSGRIHRGIFRLRPQFRTAFVLIPLFFVAWILASLPQIFAGPPTNPVQQWDPTFHLNGLWNVIATGDGRFGHSLANNYYTAQSTNYPDRWHTFVALFATGSSAVFAANSSTLALMALWIVGATVYTKLLYPKPAAVLAAPILAACMLSMPADALGAYNQWPNATALALLPGLAAFLLHIGTHLRKNWLHEGLLLRSHQTLRTLFQILFFVLALGGAVLAHQGIVFNLLVLLLPALIAGLFRLARSGIALAKVRLISRGQGVAGVVLFPLVFTVLGVIFWGVMNTGTLRAMSKYQRSGISWETALGTFLTPTPPFPVTYGLSAWVTVVALLMLAGVIAAVYYRLKIWPIFSFLSFAFLVLLAYAPNSQLRTFLTAPWFLDARRIMEPQNLSMIPLAAMGFAAVSRWISTFLGYRRTRWQIATLTAVAIFVVSAAGGMDTRIAAARGVYDPDALGKPGMVTSGELTMLQSLDQKLPAEAVVLGDPQAGAAYAQVIGQRRAYFPQLMLPTSRTENEKLIINSFNQISKDPRICKALKEEGITHYYQDADGFYFAKKRSMRMPGLYNVDTSKGFELVAEGDTAKLWRITACD